MRKRYVEIAPCEHDPIFDSDGFKKMEQELNEMDWMKYFEEQERQLMSELKVITDKQDEEMKQIIKFIDEQEAATRQYLKQL